MIWLFFIVMTIAALALVFLPFLRARKQPEIYNAAEINHSHEIEVYKDQLKEVERDLKSRILTKAEAESARLEISRRLLISAEKLEKSKVVSLSDNEKTAEKADENTLRFPKTKSIIKKLPAKAQPVALSSVKRWEGFSDVKQLGLGSSVLAGLLALGLYGFYGSPFQADQPYALRAGNKKIAPFKKEMADLEIYLEKNAEDGKAWQKMAAFYMNSGSYHKAVFAFKRSISILGENASRLTGFAEANVMVNKGKVVEPAMTAYRRALKIDPDLVEPRVRIAMGLEQQGVVDQALKAYQDVLRRSDKNAPWIPFISKRIAAITGKPVKSVPKQRTAEEKNIDNLIAKVEVSLKKNPKVGRGWDVIAPVYLSRGRYKDAKAAFEKAITLLGENGKRLSGLGEATTLLNGGTVTKEAQAFFGKALKLDPKMIEPQIRLAMALEQNDDLKKAVKAYQKIIEDSGKKTAWYPLIKERFDFVTAQLAGTPPKPMMSRKVDKGPTAQQVKDAAAMSGKDRQGMINQMVANLAGRLEKNGNDLGGWLKLMNAYNVLGKKAEVSKALAKAQTIFKDKPQALAQLASTAQRLGLQAPKISSKVDRGPTAEQVRSAASMSGKDRQGMINQMVANLAGRLEKDGNDLGGWLKLLNAYKVLGKKDEAVKALSKAQTIFKDNPQALEQLKTAAQRLGL